MAAEKISTMILKVDLDCSRCYKKIRKTLCKLQDQENIKAIAYDEKKKTVTISGPFCPQKLFKTLCCKACECILEMEIVKKTEEKKPSPATDTAPNPLQPIHVEVTVKSDVLPPPPPPPPPAVCMPTLPICLAGHACRCNCESPCRPCQEVDGGHSRPCSCGCGWECRPCRCGCGRGYVWMRGDPPACGGPSDDELGHYRPCQVMICEEGPTTCIVM